MDGQEDFQGDFHFCPTYQISCDEKEWFLKFGKTNPKQEVSLKKVIVGANGALLSKRKE